MSGTQPDRSVLPLPGELRHKIYRILVKKTYLASQRPVADEPLATSAGLVILRVSKATCTEALKILYQESVFLFKLDHETAFWCSEPPQKAVGLMTNVSFVISGAPRPSERKARSNQIVMSRRTMELFTGTATFRNVMRIKFVNFDSNRYSTSKLYDIAMKAMKDLGGFRELVVEFESAISQSRSERYRNQKLKHLELA